MHKISKHNTYEFRKTAGYKLGVNFMTDWDLVEGHRWSHGSKGKISSQKQTQRSLASNKKVFKEAEVRYLGTQNIAKSIDWRKKGAVSAPQVQGDCGACWAFTAAGALEAAHFISTGEKMIPSSQ